MGQLRTVLILAAAGIGLSFGLSGCRSDGGRTGGDSGAGPAPTGPAATGPAAEAASAPSESAVPSAVVLADAKADARPVLVCFGDSLTAGYGADPGESYPDFLQKDLDAAGYKYRVVNEGVSGATTKDGVDRLPGVEALKPAVVVVEFGGNDGLRGVPVADLRRNLDTIVGALVKTGTKVAIAGITLPPDYGPDYIRQFNATYPMLATKYQVREIPFLLEGVFGVPGMMQGDRTHATAKGNEVVAKNVLGLVGPLLKK